MDKTSTRSGGIFALIIGIDEYWSKDLPDLNGAVNDAKEFNRYLTDRRRKRGLQAPPTHIQLLLNEQATRAGILTGFKAHLLNNRSITPYKDTIIFYFAGHGSQVKAPHNMLADGKIEVICPVDERTKDATGHYVHGIPDYVLRWLLRELAEKKGPNIVVILDSCCSEGMSRNIGKARTPLTPSDWIPPDLDSHLWKGHKNRETLLNYRMWSSAPSHVLLAACGADERAQETVYQDAGGRSHGRFTWSLISTLRRIPLRHSTYAELRDYLGVWTAPVQTPHCVGTGRVILFFGRNYPKINRQACALHAGDPTSGGEWYWVEMGTVEGVQSGTEFSAVGPDHTVLCTLVANSVRIDRTILVRGPPRRKEGNPTIPQGSFAVVSDWKNSAIILQVYTPAEFPFTSDLFATINHAYRPNPWKFVEAESPEKAHIHMRHVAGGISVEWQEGTLLSKNQRSTFHALPQWPPAFYLAAAANGIAHFKYFLQVRGCVSLSGATLEMHRLVGEFPLRAPDPAVGNMIRNNQAYFVSDGSAKDGFTIRNISDVTLFPYLFYFDPDEYTIRLWYPPSGAQGRSIQHGGTITLGMGGEPGFRFQLPLGKTWGCGFFKLFVSTIYIDLGRIQQKMSPFDPEFAATDRMEMFQVPEPVWESHKAILMIMTSTK